ncbi:MAG TPA: hypothetical protein VGD14_12940 [bacterium]
MVPPFAAIISKKRRRIINAFRQIGATSSESARSLEDVGLSKSVLLEIQKLRGVLVEVAPNRFYLDEIREREVARFRRTLLAALVVFVIVVAWYFSGG